MHFYRLGSGGGVVTKTILEQYLTILERYLMRVQMVLSQWWGGRGGRVVGVNWERLQVAPSRSPWDRFCMVGVSKKEQKGIKTLEGCQKMSKKA